MKNIYTKSTYFGVLFLVLSGLISCEEDFTDIGSGVVSNTKFSTGEVVLEVEITQNNIASVRADNIGVSLLSEYWVGVYNKPYAEKVHAGFVSQLDLPSGLKTSGASLDGDTIYNLDKVVLKLPYTAVIDNTDADGNTIYKLDSILGDISIPTELEVYRNGTFINKLNPSDPSKSNSFSSDFAYEEQELLTAAAGFTFMPSPSDTAFYFNRFDRSSDVNSATVVQDTLNVFNGDAQALPFLAIPLDLDEMKRLFWDKFEDAEFLSPTAFQNYFRGIILKAKGTDGALVPFNLAASQAPSIDFMYSKTILENSVVTENSTASYSFNLANTRNSTYKMSSPAIPVPNENLVIQGMAGSSATVKILGVNLAALKAENPTDAILEYEDKDANNDGFLDLQELAALEGTDSHGLLVNDASLTFKVNETASSDGNIVPQKLIIYKNSDNGGNVTPTHIEDSYTESPFFGGNLFLSEEEKPERYNFKITDYISSLLDGSMDNFSTLELKVFNTNTDLPVTSTGILDVNVKTYNWNPRSVVLLNGDTAAQLKISYSKNK
ncbi:MAG: hypothetical protein ACI9Z4_002020 [Polaribacter sp.]